MSINCIEQKPLSEFTEKAYLDYSMYVILDRALPHLADGFKPVQRRIVYAMSELGLKSNAKYKKSARTVGDVLGKFHPHGDSACYEAMVLMAQPFSYRYPLVDGQGNWGSPDDPKSFAAMRYTESRLSAYAELLLRELQAGTVDWVDNFDATLQEPSLLPARLPNVLLNGATGIAVGMSTDILPHNLCEVANACIYLLDKPNATLNDIVDIIKAPDFPTEAEIISTRTAIHAIYATGCGSIRMRAVFKVEKHSNNIIIYALPYQVSGAKIIEQIAAQMLQKKLPMVDDLRDESDHEHPTRLVIIPRSNRIDTEALMLHLFATTDLERSYRVNFNMIGLNGKPRVKNLLTILQEWLVFRLQTVKRRIEHRLAKINARLEVLTGLLIAYLSIDAVISIIRDSDHPKLDLMAKFNLNEVQADAILDMKLRHLAKLEEYKLQSEHDELTLERDQLLYTIACELRMRTLIKNEIIADRDTYGDIRRAPIAIRPDACAHKDTDILANDPLSIILSKNGWVRAAKGYDINGTELSYKSGDEFQAQSNARSNQQVVFFDDSGKVYALPAHTLPSARGQGEPLSSKLNPSDTARFVAVISDEPSAWILLANDAGYGFSTQLHTLYVKNRNGKACFNLKKNSCMLPPQTVHAKDLQQVVCVTTTGRLLIFAASELAELTRGQGNKLIDIKSARAQNREELLSHILLLNPNEALTVHAGKRHFTLKAADLVPFQGNRGTRGGKLPRGLQNVSALVATISN